MKKYRKISLSAVFTSLCLTTMFLGSIINILDLSTVFLASIIVMLSMIELGKLWAFGVYSASALLSLVLLPDKFAALVFSLFVGYYPILKEPLNKIKPTFLSYILRFICFNVFVTVFLLIEPFTLNSQLDISIPFSVVLALLYLFLNFVFFVFDLALEKVALTYIVKLRYIIFNKR